MEGALGCAAWLQGLLRRGVWGGETMLASPVLLISPLPPPPSVCFSLCGVISVHYKLCCCLIQETPLGFSFNTVHLHC